MFAIGWMQKSGPPYQPLCCGASWSTLCAKRCGLFLVCLPLSASEAFLFRSWALCWVFGNAYTKEKGLVVFFSSSWLVIREVPEILVVGGHSPLRLRQSAEALVKEVKVAMPPQPTCLTQDLDLCVRKTFHWLCGSPCSQNQPRVLRKWAMHVVSCTRDPDLWRLRQDVAWYWRSDWSWRKN